MSVLDQIRELDPNDPRNAIITDIKLGRCRSGSAQSA